MSPNVIAAAMPRTADSSEVYLMDMTCSVIPEGKARVCLRRGTPLPECAAIDARGAPTTDPAAFYGPPAGALLPLGGPAGHKGYALGLLCEILAGALSSAGCSGDANAEHDNGLFLMAANPSHFGPGDEFLHRTEDLFSRMKDCPTASGVE